MKGPDKNGNLIYQVRLPRAVIEAVREYAREQGMVQGAVIVHALKSFGVKPKKGAATTK